MTAIDGPAVSGTNGAHGAGAETVYRRLRADIVEGRFDAGERLVEQRIAHELGVSRTPVRDALRRLASEGLVTITPNRGAAVRDLSLDEIVDLYGLRARLEGYAAELAATRITPAELADLSDAVSAFGIACDRADAQPKRDLSTARDLSRANARIHDRIVGAAHHARLRTMLDRTVDIPLVFGAFRVFGSDERRRSDLFHRLVLETISRGDGQRSAQLMTEHVNQGRDAVVAALRASGEPSGSGRGDGAIPDLREG